MKKFALVILSILVAMTMIGFMTSCGKKPGPISQSISYVEETEYACPFCGFVGTINKWEKKSDEMYVCPQCHKEVTLKVQQSSSKNNTTNQSQSKSNQTPSSQNGSSNKNNNVDLNGYKMTIASSWAGNWRPQDGISAAGDKMLAAYETIEAKYNVKINFVYSPPDSMIRDITAAIQAGKQYADVIHMPPSVFYSLAKNAIFEPVSNLPQLNANDTIFNENSKMFSTFKGKQYGIGWGTYLEYSGPGVLYYNKSILERTGQPKILDLVNNGQWTWDKFRAMCKDIQSKDSTVKGFGAIDSLSAMVGWSRANGTPYIQESNGKFVFPINNKGLLDALQFAQDIRNDGIVFENKPDDYTAWQQTILPAFKNGKLAFFYHEYYLGSKFLNGQIKDVFGMAPFPKGPNANGYYGFYTDSPSFVFLKGAKSNDKASKLLYLIAKETYQNNLAAEYGRSFTDKDSIDLLKVMEKNPLVDISIHIDTYNKYLFPELGKAAKGQETPQACINRIAPKAQSLLDDYFNQK